MYKFQDIENLGTYLYEQRLPKHYLTEDQKPEQDLALKKYLSALGEGGLNLALKDITIFLDLFDPAKCPDKYFPILFENFGLPYFQDIPIEFHRRLLINLGDLYMRKGTKGAITYLGREITGLDIVIVEKGGYMFRTWSDNPHFEKPNYILPKTWGQSYDRYPLLFGPKTNDFTFEVGLSLVDSWDDVDMSSIDLFNMKTFERFVWYFIPFDVGVYLIRVIRSSEERTDNSIDPWETKKSDYYSQYDKFPSADRFTNSEYGLLSDTLITNYDLSLDAYFANIDEFAGNDASGIYKIKETHSEIYNISKSECSLTNNQLHRTNNTFWTNSPNNHKDIHRFVIVEDVRTDKTADRYTQYDTLYYTDMEEMHSMSTEENVYHDRLYADDREEIYTFLNRLDESKTNNRWYKTNSTLITNLQTYCDIVTEV